MDKAAAELGLGLRLAVFPDDTNMQLRTDAEVIKGATSQIRELRARVDDLQTDLEACHMRKRVAIARENRSKESELKMAEENDVLRGTIKQAITLSQKMWDDGCTEDLAGGFLDIAEMLKTAMGDSDGN